MLNQQFWEKYFRTYDVLNRAIPYQELMQDLLTHVQPRTGESILDAGSGTGNLSILLSGKGAQIVAIDYSEAGIELHQEKDKNAKVVLGDLTRPLPFVNDYFDKVVSNNVLYTLPPETRGQTIAEFYRVLKPGGKVVLANVHTSYKPINILIAHVRQSLRQLGLIRTAQEIISFSIQILKVFYYNHLIVRENASGGYQFMREGEQQTLLKQAGFRMCTPSQLSFSQQSFIVSALK
jgi:ubiquinone/menaquinone biosynthesis C-methylase UbiE